MEEIKVLDEFLQIWKEKAIVFYNKVSEEYIILREEYNKIPYQCRSAFGVIPEEYRPIKHKYNDFVNMHKSFICLLYKFSPKSYSIAIEKYVEKEVQKKRQNFIKKVEKIAGKIIDASNLKMGLKAEIDGIVIGDKAKVKVNTIFAGGYNIQCLHFRVLVKEIK